jgi:hypothetical protein
MSYTKKFRPPKTKVCKGCNAEKPLKEFNINTENKDGRYSKCKKCLKAIEEKKKEDKKEYAKTFFDF